MVRPPRSVGATVPPGSCFLPPSARTVRRPDFSCRDARRRWGGPDDGPRPENCPHCLNRKPASGTCGGTYDAPRDVKDRALAWASQAAYAPEQTIVVEMVLTAHHRGHVELKGCAVDGGAAAATQACFDAHPLIFVEDLLYGAPPDPRHPERLYLHPNNGEAGGPSNPEVPAGGGMPFRAAYRLPAGLAGERVLLQWHYVTGNTCEAPGYGGYPFPHGWRGGNLLPCGGVSDTGDGAPERFWNCAEVTVGGAETPTAGAPTGSPTGAPSAAPTAADGCPDTLFFFSGKENKTCKKLLRNKPENKLQQLCHRWDRYGRQVRNHCPATCGTDCAELCADDPEFRVVRAKGFKKEVDHGCDELPNADVRCTTVVAGRLVAEHCRASCGRCA